MILINLFIFLMLFNDGSAKRRLKSNTTENSARYNFKRPPKICETTKMDVYLTELSPFFPSRYREGFLQLTTSPTRRPHFVCFPLHFRLFRQVHLLGQSACRQMGHAVAETVVGKRVPTESFAVVQDDDESTVATSSLPRGISTVSWDCLGHEQSVGQCEWYDVRMEGCRMLTEVTCGECQKSVKGSLSGFLQTPGYPVAHYYDMTCEWEIEVPDSNSITLVFNYLTTTPQEDIQCAVGKPYLEIVYGVQGSFHINRHCDFRSLKNATIPYHKVQIRYFSGLYDPKSLHVLEKEQGLAIAFKALSNEPPESFAAIDAIIISLVCAICLAGLVYFVRKTIWSTCLGIAHKSAPPPDRQPNMPGKEELERSYEFQRCKVQPNVPNPGLRLRSNGSRNNSSNVQILGTNFSERLCSTFRKFSSNSYTPRTIIPASLKSNQTKVAKFEMISRLKANLLDRFSIGSKDSCSSPSVFLPQAPPPPTNQPTSHLPPPVPTFNFSIYRSTSSEPKPDQLPEYLRVPPQETAI